MLWPGIGPAVVAIQQNYAVTCYNGCATELCLLRWACHATLPPTAVQVAFCIIDGGECFVVSKEGSLQPQVLPLASADPWEAVKAVSPWKVRSGCGECEEGE